MSTEGYNEEMPIMLRYLAEKLKTVKDEPMVAISQRYMYKE